MPRLGEVRFARELGFSGRRRYIWHACEDCSRKRRIYGNKQRSEAER